MPDLAVPRIVSRYRVGLVGRLTWEGVAAAAGCVLTLNAVPGKARAGAGTRRPVSKRVYNASVRPDGLYYFQNVPPGGYRLLGRDGKGRALDHIVTIPDGENGKRPKVIELNLQFIDLPPAVTGPPPPANAPAPLAQRGRGGRAGR